MVDSFGAGQTIGSGLKAFSLEDFAFFKNVQFLP